MLVPKLFTTLEGYDREQFTRDLIAGVIVGFVALPLAIAFAIASGCGTCRPSIRRGYTPCVISCVGVKRRGFWSSSPTCTRSRWSRSSESGFYDELGEENIHGNIDDALNRARQHLGLDPVQRPAFATPTVARESKA